MRTARLLMAVAFVVLASVAFARPDAPKGDPGTSVPAPGALPAWQPTALPEIDTGPGLDKVAPVGVSTKTVKAVPCSTAARETDGTTTCIGIPEGSAGTKRRQRRTAGRQPLK
jgi:hypothetical protein